MNTATNTELAEVAKTQTAIDAMAVVTLSPENYAAEVYQPFKTKLADAIDSVKTINYDITTTSGMAVAVRARALFRDMRVAADKERVVRKAPITKIGKLLESGFDQVEERIKPLELMFDADIAAETERKEAERAAKVLAERHRTEAIEARIQAIRNAPLAVVGKTSDEILAARDAVRDTIISEELFGEQAFRDKAMQARTDAFNALEAAHAAAVELEAAARAAEQERQAEAARIAAEREELAQLRAAAAETARLNKVESDRVAAEQAERERVQAETKRQLEAQQAAIAADRQALEAEKAAETARVQRDADHAEALVINDEITAARAAAAPAPVASPAAELLAAQANPAGADLSPAAQALLEEEGTRRFISTHRSIAPAAAPATSPSLRLGQIGTRLGFALTADFLRTLGFEPAGRDKAAVLFHEHDFTSICAALIRHIGAIQAKQAA